MTLAWIFFLILLSGLFSASEIALTSLSQAKVLAIKGDGKFGSSAINRLKKVPQRVLVSILVSNQTVNIVATFLATMWGLDLLGDQVNFLIIPFTLFLIVFGTILPKTFALGFPEAFSRAVSYPLLFLVFILRPIIWFFELIINGFSRLLKIDPNRLNKMTDKEIEAMIDIGADEGVLEEGQDLFLKHVLKFGDTKVKEVMIPLKDIAAIDITITRDELTDFLDKNNYTEFPVYQEDTNTIRGSITLHELMQLLKKTTKKRPLENQRLTQTVVIPKTANFIQLFKILTEKKKRIAIVIDQYGQTVGLVTMANIMEEITGVGAKNSSVQPTMKKIDRNLWELDGEVRVAQVNEALGLVLPFPEHQVMSLVVLEVLKRFPEMAEEVFLDEVQITVKRIEKNVVKKMEISKLKKRKNSSH